MNAHMYRFIHAFLLIIVGISLGIALFALVTLLIGRYENVTPSSQQNRFLREFMHVPAIQNLLSNASSATPPKALKLVYETLQVQTACLYAQGNNQIIMAYPATNACPSSLQTHHLQNREHSFLMPLSFNDGKDYTLYIERPFSNALLTMSFLRTWLILGLSSSILFCLLCMFLSRKHTGQEYISPKTLSFLGEPTDNKTQSLSLIDAFKAMVERIETRDTSLKEKKEKAEHANRAKSDFLMNMSHELRTPMHAILNLAEMGGRRSGDLPSAKVRQYFNQIETCGDHLLGLISGILDLAQLEAGILEFKPSYAGIKLCIEESIKRLQGLIEKKKIRIVFDRNAAEKHALFDKERILQVLINLLGNAIKFSPEGGSIHIGFSSTSLVMADKRAVSGVMVSISDGGIGIPEAELSDIFQKFTQSTITPANAGGTGLGLSICHDIITKHRGKIWASNNEKGGACFSFVIPDNYAGECITDTIHDVHVEKRAANENSHR